MNTGKIENYLRLHLLNVEEATTILRETLVKFLNKRKINDFLKQFESEITKKGLFKDAEALIYPKADIDKWDVSLLCTVLDVCCTVKYKAKTPLIILLKEETQKIKRIKKPNKEKIEENIVELLIEKQGQLEVKLTEGSITEEEFDQVFSNPVNTKFDEYSLNFIIQLLLIICGPETVIDSLRKIITKETHIMCKEIPSLVFLIESRRTLLNDLIVEGKFTTEQIQILNGSIDVNVLESEALRVAVIALCETLSEPTINAIREIKRLRLSNSGHTTSGQLDDEDFSQNWDELYHNILMITKENFPGKYIEKQKRIAHILCGNLDIKHSVQVIREGYFKKKKVTKNLDNIENLLGHCRYRPDFNSFESMRFRWPEFMKWRTRLDKKGHIRHKSGKYSSIKGTMDLTLTELTRKEVIESLIHRCSCSPFSSTRSIRNRESTAVLETIQENDEHEDICFD